MSGWSAVWPTAFPRASGPWTLRDGDRWGTLDPETGRAVEADPAADERLPGLDAALRVGDLRGYRAGRRAVVASPASFVKVVRPSRVDALVKRHDLLGAGRRCFSVPAVIAATADGRVELSVAAGRSLHHALRAEPVRPLDDVGPLIASLHDLPAPDWLPNRPPDDPGTWIAISRRSPTPHLAAIERTARALPPIVATGETLVHGDLHDKNIFLATKGAGDAPGHALIDLDSLGRGAAEDDIANLAVHLELRNLQGQAGVAFGARSRSLYESYERLRPLDVERLRVVEQHTWFRLACIYQYRWGSRHLVPELLRAVGYSRARTPRSWRRR
ncbi:MAG: phosphotransferase [Acidimicrobiales bacterium]